MKMSPEAIKANMKAMSEGQVIVPIQKNGQNIPIFCLSSFSRMKDLSSSLGNNQPFYGVLPSPTSIRLDLDSVVHEKASIILNDIKAIRPEGPYILSAYCGAYRVIFEIAQKLLDQGEKVPVIILFEAYRPIAFDSTNSFGYKTRRAKYHLGQLRDLSLINGIKLVSGIFYRKLKKLNFLTDKNKSGKLIEKTTTHKTSDPNLIKNYKGNVVVFNASEAHPLYNNYPDMGWREYVRGDLKVIIIEGDHATIFKNPNVANLAAKLSEVLMEYN
jgi:thioesterase domain-containing protein